MHTEVKASNQAPEYRGFSPAGYRAVANRRWSNGDVRGLNGARVVRTKQEIEDMARAAARAGHEVARINLDAAPVEAGLGDVRPSSSGVVNYGFSAQLPGWRTPMYVWGIR